EGRLQPVPAATTGAQLLAHPRFPDLGVILKGEGTFSVNQDMSIEVDRGTEYLPQVITPAKETTLQVRFKRWVDMQARGWWSAALHVHRNPADMPLLLEAAGLNFAPTITKWNHNTNLEVWPEQPLVRATPVRYYSVDNAEDERPWGAA